ncbi:cob(I)yrinic acid a,c-diamide adenosyltransferase [Cellulosilyticum sp. I15G10I2]|uniref:cob(I)yrinic acid a,c-diamide adenosyltransferase n=1 Tax=Cellulosilyticum sp. I15G10I2 TaxID=1892843 RepID=UPI00085BF160|nr:cob(I)yrinic acid a,c-diamide adenosyltransferase [Cellulosilyticum sp. I15G10I2]
MKIYTQTGDDGTTGLYSGERVPKTHPKIEAVGTLDELTSHLGGIKSIIQKGPIVDELEKIQKSLILLMSEVASSGKGEWQNKQGDIRFLENCIDHYEQQAGSFTKFILPGDNPLSSQVDIARTVARRAERAVARCQDAQTEVRKYINRLSDYLYVAARYIDKVFRETMKTNIQQMHTELNLEQANFLIEKVKEYAAYKGIQVVVAVVSKEGSPISVQVMDNSFVISYELAIKKAFTASALKMPTHELARLTAKGAQFEGLENMLDAKIVTLGGGCPIKVGGIVIGAIGVSGGSAEDDIEFARYGAQCIEGE